MAYELNEGLELRRDRLQKKALQLGRRLISEKPSSFIRRMESYGKTAQN
jgi:hypothetical protein